MSESWSAYRKEDVSSIIWISRFVTVPIICEHTSHPFLICLRGCIPSVPSVCHVYVRLCLCRSVCIQHSVSELHMIWKIELFEIPDCRGLCGLISNVTVKSIVITLYSRPCFLGAFKIPIFISYLKFLRSLVNEFIVRWSGVEFYSSMAVCIVDGIYRVFWVSNLNKEPSSLGSLAMRFLLIMLNVFHLVVVDVVVGMAFSPSPTRGYCLPS